ncbi:MAG: ester cyclase [Thermomicrobiales bacterium]
MPRLLAATILTVLLFGPMLSATSVRAQTATAPACVVGSIDDTRQVALDWYQSISNSDLVRFDELMSPDTRYHSATLSDFIGPVATRELYQDVLDGFTNLVYIPLEVVVQNDLVVIYYNAAGNNTGEFRGVPPTGNLVNWDGIGVMRICGGQIVETWMEIDQLYRQSQINAVNPSAAVDALIANYPHNSLSDDLPEDATPCADPAPEDAVQLFADWTDVWSTGDLTRLGTLLTPEYAISDFDNDGQTELDELSETIGGTRGAAPDSRFTVTLAAAEKDFVAGRWNAAGTMTGDFIGLPATNGPLSYSGNTVLRLECGKIAEIWSITDFGVMLDQMNADWRKKP